nr:hypothetical protein [Tanacetum cinerariifolium]
MKSACCYKGPGGGGYIHLFRSSSNESSRSRGRLVIWLGGACIRNFKEISCNDFIANDWLFLEPRTALDPIPRMAAINSSFIPQLANSKPPRSLLDASLTRANDWLRIQAVTSYRTCPLPPNISTNRSATCHHQSGATWHAKCNMAVVAATARPSVNGGQRQSTVADHRRPPVNHRWLTAGQWSGQGTTFFETMSIHDIYLSKESRPSTISPTSSLKLLNVNHLTIFVLV